jgi:hypothetical protein
MRTMSIRKLSIGAALIGTTLTGGIALASPASATVRTYNSADVVISGGNARALSLCVNVARAYARAGRPVPTLQSNRCGGATAQGGTVVVENVGVLIEQQGGGEARSNSADVVISGGDAEAVAACINYSQGRATAIQRNACAGARAQGGSVRVEDSDITVIQG